MLHTEIYKNQEWKSWNFASSKKINLTEKSTAIIQISSSDEKLGSFVENTVIDLAITHLQTGSTDIYSDFGYLLEKLNKFFKEVAKKETLAWLSVFLGIAEENTLHFSILGKNHVYLIKREKILNISEGMGNESTIPQFSYISSWAVNPGDSIHISNVDVLNFLTPEDLVEISNSHNKEKSNIIENLLEREISGIYIHLIILSCPEEAIAIQNGSSYEAVLRNILSQAKSVSWEYTKQAFEHKEVRKLIEKTRGLIESKNRVIRSTVFGIGVLVCIGLLYVILSALFHQKANTSVPEEYKNKLIEAQLIIEKANKDLGNRDAFNENIKKAEDIIFEVRKKQIFLNDVKKLLWDVSILKKQMNGVESFDPKTSPSEYLFQDKNFGVVAIFDIAKRLYFVGKNSVIGPYLKGGEAKSFNYPDGEEAISSDATSEGYIYIFTKTGRLLRFYKGEFSYVNVEGQKTWEKGKAIRVFNSNLYILSDDGKQIYKHKPGVNGFSSKSEVIQSWDLKNHTVLNFGVDGGFYLLKNDLTIDKVFGSPVYTKRSIVINNLPENYSLSGEMDPEIILGANLNYLYMVLNNQIWIFAPDTKNYKDVKSIKYIGQIEFVDEKIRSILVSKDGNVVAGTDHGIYSVNFEVSDGKVIIR